MPTESQYDFIMRTHSVHFSRRRRDLAKLSGVSLDTLNKIFQRQTKNPKSSTVQLIYDVLSEHEQKAAPVAPEATVATDPLGPILV